MPTALGLAVWQQRTKPPPESSPSPQTPTSSSSLDTPEHLPPGCPQVPAAVLMNFAAVLGAVRWDRAPSPKLRSGPWKRCRQKPSPEGGKQILLWGWGQSVVFTPIPKGWAEAGGTLTQQIFKSIFRSPEPKPHPHVPGGETEVSQFGRGAQGRVGVSCP